MRSGAMLPAMFALGISCWLRWQAAVESCLIFGNLGITIPA
jgi:hypothetical protein